MKGKKIKRALEIVYWNRDKFKLNKVAYTPYRINITTNDNSIVAYYIYPNVLVTSAIFRKLLNYDNRT